MWRFWGIGLLAALGMIARVTVLKPGTSEPVYAGKTVSQWLNGGYEQTSLALQEVGPAAAPFIFAKVRDEDPRYGSRRRYRALWAKLPPAVRPMLPRPETANFDDLRACSALLEIGPQVIPFLRAGLKDRNPGVRAVSAYALGSFRQRGSEIGSAVPSLLDALRDSNADVRKKAEWVLRD